MADINRVILVGRLTRDAELKYTQGGAAVCKFAVAINRRRKNGEEWVDEVSFFDIVLWGRQGEALNQYLVKGKQVGIEGELRQNRWEQDGQQRSKVEIIATNIQLLGSNPGTQSGGAQPQGGGAQQAPAQSAYQQRQQPPAQDYGVPDFDNSDFDNLPF
ncbi:single-stranded DNA-binding protein [Treponema phagedenis]|uniref:Single-stranded DNA-binding protein n=1 Tax=Treponema phagedenis TaxID=162 RepID=A0A0B7GTN6_TREPH|nr:single-stranded DNA-binding protein [Treponema phagedenis]EFW37187.1 single-strand binding family protein [Treponema phagedenis F0421]NVP24606.1 single-stranded DNA-binding protein [Treponema phagedenis]QEJ94702.1 single-stranded DNA-binding protein [Treponema phagedenis]QEJ97638.1 single-stranded DNA-binding protein [Treponema phagedenis]QEK00606.1 single-stranded DNA-binding protein [Treponema phagedenis]